LMLARTVPVAVARDRIDGVALARSQGATVIVMDDGFQNPAITKDASLIVIGDGVAAGPVAAAVAAQDKLVLAAHLRADDAAVAALRGKRVLAFAGIGDPQRFFRTLRANGIEIARERIFADHHPFSESEI